MARKSRTALSISKDKPRRVVQRLAQDEFGELRERKREAERIAREKGHDLKGWRRRANDPAGRWNNYCATCNRMVVACTETPEGFTDFYGDAVTQDCGTQKRQMTYGELMQFSKTGQLPSSPAQPTRGDYPGTTSIEEDDPKFSAETAGVTANVEARTLERIATKRRR